MPELIKKLRYDRKEGHAFVDVIEPESKYIVDRYWAEGNNVVHVDIHGNESVMSWKEHCKGLEHFQALNEIGLLNACACLDSILRISPENLEFIKSTIEEELDLR